MKPYLAPSVLFFSYLLPFLFFFALVQLFPAAAGAGIAYFVGAILTMGILGNGLWGAGMRSVKDREANIPVAAMVSGWPLYLPALFLLLAIAHFQYAMPLPRNWISLFVLVTLGVCAFRAIGLVLAAVTNTTRQAVIAILLLYMPMLFLSGATIPAVLLPNWAQTLAQFMPASYLVSGFQGIFFRNQTLADNAAPVAALVVTILAGTFLARQLFRWKKEEKPAPRNKLWVVAVLGPFLLMGGYRAYSRDYLGQNRGFFRDLQRSGSFLIRNVRIFTGDGKVIENGGVLVRDGKISQVYDGPTPDPQKLRAGIVEGAGKTLLPGLIDAHVHLGAPAGISDSGEDDDPRASMQHAAAALLYSGVTAARSVGDGLDASLALRRDIAQGGKLGAQLFVCGPMFTSQQGHGAGILQYLPESLPESKAQLVRIPKSPDEARRQVRDLKRAGVDCIKTILEAGSGDGMLYDRMDLLLARSVAEQARADRLPLAVHTGDARDVTDAVDIGAASVEHGSLRDELPGVLLERMARRGVYLDPTLGVAEAYSNYYDRQAGTLNTPLIRQTVPPRILEATRAFVASGKAADPARADRFAEALEQCRANLLAAWKAGVPLVVGTGAGNPLVFPGPSMHHELRLWVEAGIPPAIALLAATANAAKLLGASDKIGVIRPGLDADLLLVDGNPLEDIGATERISLVVFKGERLRRPELFQQK